MRNTLTNEGYSSHGGLSAGQTLLTSALSSLYDVFQDPLNTSMQRFHLLFLKQKTSRNPEQ